MLCWSVSLKRPLIFIFFFGNHIEILHFSTIILNSYNPRKESNKATPLDQCFSALQRSLALFYLDDGTLCGHPDTVLSDFRQIIDECRHIGLSINPSKCELYFCSEINSDVTSAFQLVAPTIKIVSKHELTLLVSPIFGCFRFFS